MNIPFNIDISTINGGHTEVVFSGEQKKLCDLCASVVNICASVVNKKHL